MFKPTHTHTHSHTHCEIMINVIFDIIQLYFMYALQFYYLSDFSHTITRLLYGIILDSVDHVTPIPKRKFVSQYRDEHTNRIRKKERKRARKMDGEMVIL